MNIVTDKYKGAIESFSADLQLAKSGLKELKELDKLLADNNERLLKDIDLLDELDFNLRYGNIMLVELANEGCIYQSVNEQAVFCKLANECIGDTDYYFKVCENCPYKLSEREFANELYRELLKQSKVFLNAMNNKDERTLREFEIASNICKRFISSVEVK